jgi:threonine dehydratase
VSRWRPNTVADGLRALVGRSNFKLISQRVTDILLVEDRDTVEAMRLMLEVTGLRLEPSAAVVIAAIRQHPERFAERRVGVILSGGNYDPSLFPWLEPAETAPGEP